MMKQALEAERSIVSLVNEGNGSSTDKIAHLERLLWKLSWICRPANYAVKQRGFIMSSNICGVRHVFRLAWCLLPQISSRSVCDLMEEWQMSRRNSMPPSKIFQPICWKCISHFKKKKSHKKGKPNRKGFHSWLVHVEVLEAVKVCGRYIRFRTKSFWRHRPVCG